MKHVFLFLLILVLAACSRQPAPETVEARVDEARPEPARNELAITREAQDRGGVKTGLVRKRSLAKVVRSTARVTNDENRTWRVGAITDGRIVKALVNPGDDVKEGDALALIHSHDIHEARALYRQAMNELARAKANAAFAQTRRDRMRRLYELKAASLEQKQQAENEWQNAQTVVDSNEVEVERNRRHLEEFLGIPAEEPSHHGPGEHDDDEDLIPVRAPATGRILVRRVNAGTVVTPADELFLLSDLSNLWVIAELPLEYLPALRVGMSVRITVSAYGGRVFTGRVGKIGEVLTPDTRTVQVRIDVPNSAGLLKPEMYAMVEIASGDTREAVFVPQGAVQEVSGQKSVFVRRAPDRFEVRVVETGELLEGDAEIVHGLSAGETIAVAGTFILKSEFLKASLAEE